MSQIYIQILPHKKNIKCYLAEQNEMDLHGTSAFLTRINIFLPIKHIKTGLHPA